MNFQNLLKIEKNEFYLDRAFKEAKKVKISKKGNKLENFQRGSLKQIATFSKTLNSLMENIVKNFPSIDHLALFYQELIEIHVGVDKLKRELATISWIKDKIIELNREAHRKIKSEKNTDKITKIKKDFYGRASSIIERKKKTFEFLENARKKMRGFPSVKTDIPTICIAGFPNVGKSSLLVKLTGAGVEVNDYPFTTKGLMVGYIKKEIQLIDTPGTFTDKKKMNFIERQAFLALKYLAEKIIFVFDLSESCGYEIEKQEDLFEIIRKRFRNKPLLIYFSKSDLIKEKLVGKYTKKYKKFNSFSESEKLKEFLME